MAGSPSDWQFVWKNGFPGDDVRGNQFSERANRFATRINHGGHGGDIAFHDDRDASVES